MLKKRLKRKINKIKPRDRFNCIYNNNKKKVASKTKQLDCFFNR